MNSVKKMEVNIAVELWASFIGCGYGGKVEDVFFTVGNIL